MNKLTKCSMEVLAIGAGNDVIRSSMTDNIQKQITKTTIGVVMTLAAVLGSNFAHADCSVSSANPVVTGVSALAVGGAAAAIFGGGLGKVLLGVGGAAVGAIGANSIQNASHAQDCARASANNYNREGYAPQYRQNSQLPPVPILYLDVDNNARIVTVTMQTSLGINALHGVRDGSIDPRTNPVVEHALEVEESVLTEAYNKLDGAAQYYNSLAKKNTVYKESDSARYAVDNVGARLASQEKDAAISETVQNDRSFEQERLYRLKNFNDAFSNYGIARSMAAKIFDNAAGDGYHLEDRQTDLKLFTPPSSAEVTWGVVHNTALPSPYINVNTYNRMASGNKLK